MSDTESRAFTLTREEALVVWDALIDGCMGDARHPVEEQLAAFRAARPLVLRFAHTFGDYDDAEASGRLYSIDTPDRDIDWCEGNFTRDTDRCISCDGTDERPHVSCYGWLCGCPCGGGDL
jgi:hypothetical protein